MNEVISSFGPDSDEVHQQCVGNMRTGMLLRRVVTRDLCRQFKAQDDVIWKGRTLTRVYFVDAAYGGDRCVAGYCEFGEDIEGKQIFNVKKPKIIPIKVGKGMAEDQIANYVKEDCDAAGIPPENMGHDATGRGSLGTALARVWFGSDQPHRVRRRPHGSAGVPWICLSAIPAQNNNACSCAPNITPGS